MRREAYVLSKLQSLSAWRGQLVDMLISQHIVPALNRHQAINQDMLLKQAKSLFDLQLDFALRHHVREPNMKIGAYRLAQRPLQFVQSGVTVKALPDLIVFYDDEPPIIVDWKVHAFGTCEYRLQLALYAMALTRCKPHKDFPALLQRWVLTDIRLLEAQLLISQLRHYSLTEGEFNQVETHIAETAHEMLLARGDESIEQLRAEDFAVTQFPELCQRCSFRKPCWEIPHVHA